MSRKKLTNILFAIGLISFVIISSCNPNEGESGKEKTAIKRDTLNNWLTVNISFHPKASYELRREYLEEIKEYLSKYVSSYSDTTKHRTVTAAFNQTVKDSLQYAVSVIVHKVYYLKDSVSDPKCPPLPGPRTIELAQLEILCGLLNQ